MHATARAAVRLTGPGVVDTVPSSACPAVKIALDDIKASPKQLSYIEDVAELNDRLGRGVQDYRVTRGLEVAVEYYRAGLDLLFSGSLTGAVQRPCGRRREDYAFGLEHTSTLAPKPRAAGLPSHGREGGGLTADDLELSHYEGDEIDLPPLVHEQMIQALPTR